MMVLQKHPVRTSVAPGARQLASIAPLFLILSDGFPDLRPRAPTHHHLSHCPILYRQTRICRGRVTGVFRDTGEYHGHGIRMAS